MCVGSQLPSVEMGNAHGCFILHLSLQCICGFILSSVTRKTEKEKSIMEKFN